MSLGPLSKIELLKGSDGHYYYYYSRRLRFQASNYKRREGDALCRV